MMNNRRPHFLLLCNFALISSAALPLSAGDDEESSEIMELVSETDNCSAKLARNKNATEKEKKEDKKRKRIGIGETVTVTLTSKKPALLEPKEQIRWKVTQGKGLLEGELRIKDNKPETAKFRVNPSASKEQILQAKEIVIETETEQGIALPKPIKFEVVFPEQLTAEHETLGGLTHGTPCPEYPQDGSANPGTSAMLRISVHPLDVCYEGIWIIEKDKGLEGGAGSLAGPHNADSKWSVNKENRFNNPDNIGIAIDRELLNKIQGVDASGHPVYVHQYPNKFTWNCLFRTFKFPDMKGISDVTTVYQRFHIDRKDNDQFYMRIKKFLVDPNKNDECSVERTSCSDHIFTP